ncbi:hypothetical protein BDK51DRAFT_42529 [Blyttiomyces helicus]|uniref:Pentacotripeptide-repeat region of PRORP domain-containing protein n=1 Tax=Blyttiomyces helicus TaxID=388810 RepID=A0A4P9W8W9_9FUNG|nr:hypothetical protein BDK51DRAFT_42529 [Blyttiomyces helicus]|eukprot:RKO86626.1 hypothetical protein BDK51DRAFT_42529 [Blyttiomyces helicus]
MKQDHEELLKFHELLSSTNRMTPRLHAIYAVAFFHARGTPRRESLVIEAYRSALEGLRSCLAPGMDEDGGRTSMDRPMSDAFLHVARLLAEQRDVAQAFDIRQATLSALSRHPPAIVSVNKLTNTLDISLLRVIFSVLRTNPSAPPEKRLHQEAISSLHRQWPVIFENLTYANGLRLGPNAMKLVIELHVLRSLFDPAGFPMPPVMDLFEDSKRHGFMPDASTYHALMRGWAKDASPNPDTRDIKAYEILQAMRRAGLAPSTTSYAILFSTCTPISSPRRNGLSESEKLSLHSATAGRLKSYERDMQAEGLVHDAISFPAVIEAFISNGWVLSAWRRILGMRRVGLSRDRAMHNTFIRWASFWPAGANFAINNVRHAMLREKPDVVPDAETFEGLLACCARIADPVTALELYAEMQAQYGLRPGPAAFEALLEVTGGRAGLLRVERARLVADMRRLGVVVAPQWEKVAAEVEEASRAVAASGVDAPPDFDARWLLEAILGPDVPVPADFVTPNASADLTSPNGSAVSSPDQRVAPRRRRAPESARIPIAKFLRPWRPELPAADYTLASTRATSSTIRLYDNSIRSLHWAIVGRRSGRSWMIFRHHVDEKTLSTFHPEDFTGILEALYGHYDPYRACRHSTKIADAMRDLGHRLDPRDYRHLMTAFNRAGDLRGVAEVAGTMVSEGWLPQSWTYAILVAAFGAAGRLDTAMAIWQRAVWEVSGARADPDLVSAATDAVGRSSGVEAALEIALPMCDARDPHPLVVETVTRLLGRAGRRDAALRVVEAYERITAPATPPPPRMPLSPIFPPLMILDAAVEACEHADDTETASTIFSRMLTLCAEVGLDADDKPLAVPPLATYRRLMALYARLGDIVMTDALFNAAVEAAYIPDTAMHKSRVTARLQAGDVSGAVEAYDFMREEGYVPDMIFEKSIETAATRMGLTLRSGKKVLDEEQQAQEARARIMEQTPIYRK